MYRNILIPVVFDADANTEKAFAAARALADDDARFTLLHVVETIPVYVSEYIPTDVLTNVHDNAAAKLKALAETLPNAQPSITDGRAGPRISRWAEENGNDCIVIASHQPAFSDILLGSVAHHVVRHASCAVHVVQ